MEYAESQYYLCSLEERAYRAFRCHVNVSRENFHRMTVADPLIQRCFHNEFVHDYLGKDENWKLREPRYHEFRTSFIVFGLLNGQLYGKEPYKDGWSPQLHWARFGYACITGIGSIGAYNRLPVRIPKSFSKALYYLLVFLTHQWIIDNHPEDMPAL